MNKRDFDEWFSTFTDSINGYNYYTDFEKVYNKASQLKPEIYLLNSLVGSKNIEAEFETLLHRFPDCLKAIPILLAVRNPALFCRDGNGSFNYTFDSPTPPIPQYSYFHAN